MENIKRLCSLHQKEIIYICFNSAWHCEVLCSDCLIIHSDNHVKNNSLPKIESFEMFIKQYLAGLDKKAANFQNILIECNNFLNFDQKELFLCNEQLKELIAFKRLVDEEISKKFDELETNIKYQILQKYDIIKKDIQNSKNNFLNLQTEIEKHIEIIRNETSNDKLVESLKFSFKFMNSNEKNKDFTYFNDLIPIKLENLLEINIQNFMKILNENFINFIKLVKIDEKDKEKIKENKIKEKQKNLKNLCKSCGLEMSYISDFKKHLVCNSCNSVKRLYGKK